MPDYGIGSWPHRRARLSGSAIALRQAHQRVTYSELAGRVELLASALASRGVDFGDRVAYLGLNDIAALELLFAVGRLGAVFVPLNLRLTAREIGYLLSDSRPAVLVHGSDQDATVVAADPAACGVGLVVALGGPESGGYEGLVAAGRGLSSRTPTSCPAMLRCVSARCSTPRALGR
jgi:fatty-acyl-CoA synthase